MGWIHFSSEEELHNALQQENHALFLTADSSCPMVDLFNLHPLDR